MFTSYPLLTISIVAIVIILLVYIAFYMLFARRVKVLEQGVLEVFLRKVSKIPALIEVMRPYISKKEAFAPIIEVHTESMISSTDSLYDILSYNARLQNEFLFLMKLSVQVPELQKHEYFLYIRDFIIEYERTMRSRFAATNEAIHDWNHFITIKNMTGIGYLLPGSLRPEII